MKRLIAYLCALALAFASSTGTAQLTQTGAGKKAAAAGGGATVTFDSSVTFTAEDASSYSSTAAWTITSSGDRWAVGAMLSRDFTTLATHTEMRISGSGGTPMPELGAEATVDGSARVSTYGLVAPGSGASRVLYGLISEVDSNGSIAGAAYYNVHQTTPVNSTATPTNEAFASQTSRAPSITVTTTTNGSAVAVLYLHRGTTDTPSISGCTSGATVRATIHSIQETIWIIDRPDASGSTTIACTISFLSASGEWYMRGYGVQPP